MKDRDLEFIREKFDNCGVNAPEALGEQAILEQLPAQPVREAPPKNRKKWAAGISAVAAAAVITAGAVTFTSMFCQLPAGKQTGHTSVSLRAFGSRDELKTELNKVMRVSERVGNDAYSGFPVFEAEMEDGASRSGSSSSSGASSGTSGGASSSHNSTYVQTVGVDEADIVKTTDRYIFYLVADTIRIFSAEGKNAREVASVGCDGLDALSDFYIAGDRLVTLGVGLRNDSADGASGSSFVSTASVYDIADVSAIRQLGTFTQSGNYISSRMIGDTLYIVSDQPVYDENDIPKTGFSQGATADSATMDEVPVSDIFAVDTPAFSQYLVVSSVGTANGAQATKTKAILGSAGIIYCNRDNLYVTAQEYAPAVYRNVINGEDVLTGIFGDFRAEETQIIKISLEKDIDFVADGKVRGMIDDQYALDEYNGCLRVATTSYDNGSDVNNLFVLDGELRQIGAVTGFAAGERIKAVRYINETAYVITYEQTDPLFVIDVSEPTKPAILGEVKISGFSTMLVPVDDNTLLGIGYSTGEYDYTEMEVQDGLKIVTFDVTDKANPKVTDTEVFPEYFSEVQYNPKALLVNFERGDYTIPMSRSTWSESGQTYLVSNEALNFRVDNGEITIVDRYASGVFTGENDSLGRCVYVGSTVYLLGTRYENYTSMQVMIDSVPYK